MQIKNIHQAREALTSVDQFFQSLENVFAGNTAQPEPVVRRLMPCAPKVAQSNSPGMTAGIHQILKEFGGTLTTDEMDAEFRARKWSRGINGYKGLKELMNNMAYRSLINRDRNGFSSINNSRPVMPQSETQAQQENTAL